MDSNIINQIGLIYKLVQLCTVPFTFPKGYVVSLLEGRLHTYTSLEAVQLQFLWLQDKYGKNILKSATSTEVYN